MYGNGALTVTQWQGVKFDAPFCNETVVVAGQMCEGEDVLQSLNFDPVSWIRKKQLLNRLLTFTFFYNIAELLFPRYYVFVCTIRGISDLRLSGTTQENIAQILNSRNENID